ncbi:uncharacterized protein LOC6563138 isoform X2 [Drosophila grimshawi]|uniref:GH18984 n=2 Tax=Drosophila grimshawi TaxID=7222 RepID=B4JHT5_DROGR|nr:uncharacterized protein LOC6563138 isoform X2 [Drosophila grimshawi]EDV92843.1 GH18984 [Drosophila grimshawi]
MERASSPLLQSHLSLPLVQQPKSRGRPRASYAQTGEFDLGLIREYHLRPALYDRSNKRFKDKAHAMQLWMQISHKLGYAVPILRDRFITLRNRYNIEKRRVENNCIVGSQWPLYENLSFLSEHIRTRRSYKRQSKSVDDHHPDDGEDEEHVDVQFDMNSDSNGPIKTIKHELVGNDDNSDCIYDDDRQLPVTTVLSIPQSAEINGGHNNNNINGGNSYRQPELVVAGVKQRRRQGALEEEPQAKRNSNSTALSAAVAATATTATSATSITTGAPATTPTAITTYPKFRAFGEFVSHSLNELPHSVSMRLIEKFTHDLVQATIKRTANESRDSAEPSSLDEMDD